MMESKIVWGFDIGGTKTALCIGDEQGRILRRYQVATKNYASWRDLMDELIRWGKGQGYAPCAVGISCGGPLNSISGVILSPPNLPGWDEVPMVEYIESQLHVPAFLQNDANACALAEWKYGAGRGFQNVIFLTFGTGFGGGLILNGHLYEGTNGMSGEVGHIRLTDSGPWGYGKFGAVEGYCSGGGLHSMAQDQLGMDYSAKDLVQLAEKGDLGAQRVLSQSAEMLGRTLSILIDLLNPECIILGSIFQRAEKWFRPKMKEMIERETLPLSRSVCCIRPAELKDEIGDMGAMLVAWNGLRERENAVQAKKGGSV